MKKFYTVLSGILIYSAAFTQLQLKPAIGPASLPGDNDAICPIVCSSNYNFNTGGLQVGDTIPQFTFYKPDGTPVDALSQLQTGKPLLLIAGSITCPVYRGKISAINNIIATYGSQINTFIVYVVEAHPNTPSISPYSCNVWTHSQNISEGVLYQQQTTYGQRKTAVTDMMNNVCSCMPTINAPVIIDGPCNDYWTTFGEAPNNAYLINPVDGTVNCKHGWFNQVPSNMADCIDALLAVLAVDDHAEKNNSRVFPNPTSDRTIIEINSFQMYDQSSLQVSLSDVFGRSIDIPYRVVASGLEIQKGDLVSGVYFYNIRSGNKIAGSGKIIIQ